MIPFKAKEEIYGPPIVFVEDSFYVIGGTVDYSESNKIARFNSKTRKWSKAGELFSAKG